MKKTIAQQLGVTDFPFEVRDRRGNIIYKEYKEGFWVKREFDSENRELHFQRSDNYWVKWEYDEEGEEIYYEDSNGLVQDNRTEEQKLTTKI